MYVAFNHYNSKFGGACHTGGGKQLICSKLAKNDLYEMYTLKSQTKQNKTK